MPKHGRKPKMGIAPYCPLLWDGKLCGITMKPAGKLCFTPRYAGCAKIKSRKIR